jgi:hypothetical protein
VVPIVMALIEFRANDPESAAVARAVRRGAFQDENQFQDHARQHGRNAVGIEASFWQNLPS